MAEDKPHFKYRAWLKGRVAPFWPIEAEIVLVQWRDAAEITDGEEKNTTPLVTLTIGFVTEASKSHVVVAHHIDEQEDGRDRITIPAKMVDWVLPVFKGPVKKKDK